MTPSVAHPPRRLGVLVSGEWPEVSPGGEDTMIGGIASDSRDVRPGDLFVAIRGGSHDGHEFVPAALEAGAAAILVERVPEDVAVPWARVRDTRWSLGSVAAVFYGDPSGAMTLAGVTGTNGKTTTCWLLDEAFFRLAGASLLAGTLGSRLRSGERRTRGEAGLTTGSPVELQAFLAEGRRRGCAFGVVECSSHGLHQGRLQGTFFRAAVFTNLTPEHLDYHGDLDAYYRAKRLLFSEHLRGGGIAVIGIDDPHGARLAEDVAERRPDVILATFGFDPAATVRILENRSAGDAQTVRLGTPAGEQILETAMPGAFAARNLAGAWAALFNLDFAPEEVTAALSGAPAPPGRMEPVRLEEQADAPLVLVDFAHSPDALEQALRAARDLAGAGRLWTVFGCGGERDPGKRAPMGRLAASLADRVVLTADNSRSEDPERIVAAVREGAEAERPGSVTACELERRDAIRYAVREAAPEDVVLVAGRGAETHQHTARGRLPCDDRDLVRDALREEARR